MSPPPARPRRATALAGLVLGLGLSGGPALAAPPAQQAAQFAAQQARTAAALRVLEDQTAALGTRLANLEAAQAQAQTQLAAAQAALARLLPIMQRLSAAPAQTLLMAPQSPADSVRGLALLQGVAAAIVSQSQDVEAREAQLATLIAAAKSSDTQLTQAVAAQSAADSVLNRQISAAKAALLAAADEQAAIRAATLAAQNKLDNLQDAVANLAPASAPAAPSAPPPLVLPADSGGPPVAGRIIGPYGAQTDAGPATGISYATAPGANVAAPCAGTVLFAGPFPSYGQVVIADCGDDLSVVLAGMNLLDVVQGEHLVHGQPVGAMQGFEPAAPTYQPRLYVELRQNGTPVDPTAWLRPGASG
ncbi:murein hydrolase activator EnvC [Acidocella sp.]|uniref:murein hydrolase activator EnvC family protein n=1 Tax=Acidocella sp. TaxID=50710 RepID=UPI00260FCD12|nr:peptidoglycan DD-metalloendopeptidase family protein [Acidocella sp.]